jgi:ankyrin repeat protein
VALQLLAAGASALAANFWGRTALAAAAQGISEAALQALMKAVDMVDTHLGMTPLMQPARSDHEAMVRGLLSAGADATGVDAPGRTVLALACRFGRDAVARQLLEAGAGPRAVDAVGGWTPLQRASLSMHATAVVQLLLASRAAIDAITSDGCTPLMKAVAVGREDVLCLLTEAGTDPDLPDAAGASPLHVAE